jgi:hypothetical protein
MTARTNTRAIDHLADVLVEDILSTPAEELLAEVAEDYGNPRALVDTFDKIAQRARATHNRIGGALPATAIGAVGSPSLRKFKTAGGLKSFWQDAIPSALEAIFPNRLVMIGVSSACVASLAFIVAAPMLSEWLHEQRNGGVEIFDGSSTAPQVSGKPGDGAGVTRGLPSLAPPTSPAVPSIRDLPVLDLPSEAGGTAPPAAGRDPSTANPVQPSADAPRVATASGPAADSYVVQLSTQRTMPSAEAFLRNFQAKYAKELGDRKTVIRRADPGANSAYLALVGPFGSADEANRFCSSLKAAGGQCTVQKE